eukprot:9146809-Lingulodinium_polyedra.AAC.1
MPRHTLPRAESLFSVKGSAREGAAPLGSACVARRFALRGLARASGWPPTRGRSTARSAASA